MSIERYPLINSWLDFHVTRNRGAAIPGLQTAIYEGGTESYSGSYGWADSENDIWLTDEHVMPCGSVTKSVAVIEILRAVEMGKLSLDAVPADLLPIAARNVGRAALGSLIAHTSGLPMELTIPGVYTGPDPAKRTIEPEEFLDVLGEMPLKFEPGTAQGYSNSGIALGVMMLEAAMEESFSSLAKKNVLEPLGMTSSEITAGKARVPRVYSYINQEACDSEIVSLGVYSRSSGLMSNARDLTKLGAAHLGGYPDVVSPESLHYIHEQPRGSEEDETAESTAGRGVFLRPDGVALYGMRSFCTARIRVREAAGKVTAVLANSNDTMKLGKIHQGIEGLSNFLREHEPYPEVTTYTDGRLEVQQVVYLQGGRIAMIEPLQENPVPVVWHQPPGKLYFERFSGQGHKAIVVTDTELQGERVTLYAVDNTDDSAT